jgi:hypothetical protein
MSSCERFAGELHSSSPLDACPRSTPPRLLLGSQPRLFIPLDQIERWWLDAVDAMGKRRAARGEDQDEWRRGEEEKERGTVDRWLLQLR